MKESGILEMNTVVVGISEPIEASITTTLIAKDSEGTKVKRVIALSTDKACNPVNLYGATKASCDLLLKMYYQNYKS